MADTSTTSEPGKTSDSRISRDHAHLEMLEQMEGYLEDLLRRAEFHERGGNVANYIPELRMALKTKIGISVFHKDGGQISKGDSSRYNRLEYNGGLESEKDRENDDSFTIQSFFPHYR